MKRQNSCEILDSCKINAAITTSAATTTSTTVATTTTKNNNYNPFGLKVQKYGCLKYR